jgi:hypothetical protein
MRHWRQDTAKAKLDSQGSEFYGVEFELFLCWVAIYFGLWKA